MTRPTEGMPAREPVLARAEIPGTLISDYVLRQVAAPRELVLILHGFKLSGKIVYDKLASSCPADAAVLAPNGPFPLPERKEDGSYRAGFSWYFYDPVKDVYFIDMRVAIELLTGLVRELGFEDLPKRVVGFSQGGYLAGLAALELKNVVQVVAVAASHLPEEIEEALRSKERSWPQGMRMDSVHGAKDDVVSIEEARQAHEKLAARGVLGRFVVLADEGHRLSPAVRSAVSELLSLSAGSPGSARTAEPRET